MSPGEMQDHSLMERLGCARVLNLPPGTGGPNTFR